VRESVLHSTCEGQHLETQIQRYLSLKAVFGLNMGGFREDRISRSILDAIYLDRKDEATVLARIKRIFSIIQLFLTRFKDDLFQKLRQDVWGFSEDEYKESFRRDGKGKAIPKLLPIGDLGYSGSVSLLTSP
jgi:hypothetical protein